MLKIVCLKKVYLKIIKIIRGKNGKNFDDCLVFVEMLCEGSFFWLNFNELFLKKLLINVMESNWIV